MISSKHITKISAILTAIVLILCIASFIFQEELSSVFVSDIAYSMEYPEKLFDTDEVIDLNIIIDDSDWEDMLENAMAEEYYKCDVTINGTSFKSVGIRPKGNTSLSSIARDPENDRYSFKLEFDRFAEGQTCFGLDKLVLNNSYADATYMKETVIYDMFNYIGADASLYNYAKISVNGNYWGIYLALEGVEESFMLRNYGAQNGKLYKPEFMNHGEKDRGENQKADVGRGGFMNSNGSNLNYIDDELDSYSAIWEGEVNSSDKNDHKRVVSSLKNINQKTNTESSLDVDNLLKYMAVHTFSVNDDSLSGGMAHNYYLYEANGRLNLIPWDYNLAFGGMHSKDSSSVINRAIDQPFSSTDLFDIFLENEEYLEKYHSYCNQLIDEYVFGGKFEETYNRTREQIDELVKADPNAMYSYDEYTAAAEILYDTVMLRAKSVQGQLDGSIPSTSDSQKSNPDPLLDASDIDISAMGTMGGGGFERRNGGQMPAQNTEQSRFPQNGERPEFPQNGERPEFPQGGNRPDFSQRGENFPNPPGFNENSTPVSAAPVTEEFSLLNFIKEYQTPIIAVILLLLSFVFIKFYKRKNY